MSKGTTITTTTGDKTMTYMIIDSTSNHGEYIGEDGDNTSFGEQAAVYETRADAELAAKQLTTDNIEWSDWAFILKRENG
jgi:hypothetical protein